MPTPSLRPPSSDLIGFLAAYDPSVSDLALALRTLVLEEAHDASELVYDAYNSVAVAFTFTGQLSGAFCHIAAYRNHVNLGFNRGAELTDPEGLLQGSGKLIRHLRVTQKRDLGNPALRHFVRAAIAQAPRSTQGSSAGASRVQAVSARRRRPGLSA